MSTDLDSARQEFMTSVMQFVKEELGIEEVEYDSEKFQIKSGDWFFFLGNAFQEYNACKSEEEKQAVLERYLRDIRLSGEDEYKFEDVRTRLFPAVRDRQLIENTELDYAEKSSVEQLKALPQGFPRKVIAEHYVLLIAIDNEKSISYVNKTVIDGWNVPFDELMTIAIENLKRTSSSEFVEIADGVYASGWQDTYDTSRILLTDKVREECKVQGQHLAFLASRDHVFITGSDDIPGIKMVLEICKELEASPRPLYMVPLVLEADEWKVFDAPEFHPCHHELKLAKVIALNAIFQDSQNTLNQKLTDDIFVATYTALQSKDSDDIYTVSVWACRSLLPKTEWIDFMDVDVQTEKATSLGKARWEDVEAFFGDRFIKTFEYPPRSFLDDFPLEQLKGLTLVEEFPVGAGRSFAPPAVRSYEDVIVQTRERFMNAYREVANVFRNKPGCAPEVLVQRSDLQGPEVFTTKRIDYLISENEQYHDIIIEGRSTSVEPNEYKLKNGLSLFLKPVSWTFMEFICDKFDTESLKFVDWCNHWMNLNESFAKDPNGFAGVLHSISMPASDDVSTTFVVDFGSAPMLAFDSLLDVLSELGVVNVLIRTPWNVLLR